MKKVFLAGFFVFSQVAAGSPEVLEAAKKNLIDVVKTEATVVNDAQSGIGRQLISAIREFENALRTEYESSVESALSRFEQSGQVSEDVKKAVEGFRKTYAAERKRAEDEQIADYGALLKEAAEKMKSAEEPAALDDLVERLNQLGRSRDSERSRELQRIRSDATNVKQVVAAWQDYLAAKKSGGISEMSSALSNVTSYMSHAPQFLPRSWLLEQRYRPQKPEELRAASLADVKALIGKLEEIRDSNRRYQMMGAIAAFGALQSRYEQYLNGTSFAIRYQESQSSMDPLLAGDLTKLKADLQKLCLPKYIKAPEDLQPAADETSLQYLARISAFAAERGDFPLAGRALRATAEINEAPQKNVEIQCLEHCVSGKNQEEAGQYEFAVVSYQKALAGGSDVVPVKWVSGRLAEIKTKQPEMFEKGKALFAASLAGTRN